jgi:pyruvate,water dikinase
MGKITGEISSRQVSPKTVQHVPAARGGVDAVPVTEALCEAASLSDDELQALRGLARAVERHYGCAQDIEWAVDRHTGAILLLQSRPETVWSAREAAPVARAAADPLSHLMSVFGGRRSP